MSKMGVLSNFMLLSQYPDPVVLLNSKLKIVFANESFFEDFKKIDDKFFTSLIEEDQRALFRSWWARFLSKDLKRQSSYFNCFTAQRGAEYCHLTAKKINRNNDSKPLFILVSLQNLTEHQNMFQQDMEKSINEAISEVKGRTELLANTSHELRTPIQTILGTAELIKESDINHGIREHCDQICFSADILLTLINDILDYSKIEAGKIEMENIPFQISELVESTAEMIAVIASKKEIDVGVYIPPEIPETVSGDPARIRQILINLCNNAVKFTSKGEVVITVDQEHETEDQIFIRFNVNDSGIGIPEEKQKDLFSAFQQADSSTTRQYGGTGLGLYISKSFVKQMGGEISIKSIVNIGTTFSVTIPFPKKTIKREHPLPSLFFSEQSVLVVDDNKRIREIMVQYLSEWGVYTFEATNGLEAAEFLKQKAKEGNPIDICLADQQMPQWGGWQLAREIHTNPDLSETKTILLLLRGKGMEEAAMMKLGWAKAYLRKPIRKAKLFEILFHVLNDSIELRESENELDLSAPPTELEGVQDLPVEQNRPILIVEDHITNQQLFNSFLSKEGFLVSLASNGAEAVEQVKERNFAMIFMDCQMPVMNGYDATVEIRKLGYTMPVVAITAGTFEAEWEKCSNAGMDDLLPKPFKKRDVIECAIKHLTSKKEEE